MSYITIGNLNYFATKFAEKITGIFAKKTDIPKSLPANGGDAATVGGHSVGTDVPANAKFTDTTYSHPTSAGNKHIPTGGAQGQILRWSASGTAVWGDETKSGVEAATESEIDTIIAGTFK